MFIVYWITPSLQGVYQGIKIRGRAQPIPWFKNHSKPAKLFFQLGFRVFRFRVLTRRINSSYLDSVVCTVSPIRFYLDSGLQGHTRCVLDQIVQICIHKCLWKSLINEYFCLFLYISPRDHVIACLLLYIFNFIHYWVSSINSIRLKSV